MSATTLWAWAWTRTAWGWTQGTPPTSSSHDTVEAEEPRLVRREDGEVCRVEGGVEEVREVMLELVECGGRGAEAPYISCHTVRIRVLVVLVVPLHRVVGLHHFISLYHVVAIHVIASFNHVITPHQTKNPHHWVNEDRVWMQMQIENRAERRCVCLRRKCKQRQEIG
ncbi:hypothetical protein JB92DRAFT_3034167 [Gautieria morchelliformis]|nr:hypothetical protein JB92DRAFT_3034167 [Gautieria morchelliformis]